MSRGGFLLHHELLDLHDARTVPVREWGRFMSSEEIDTIFRVFPEERLPNGRTAWPTGVFLMRNGHVISDPFCVADVAGRLVAESATLNVAQVSQVVADVRARSMGSDVKYLSGTHVCMFNWSAHNYYHWLIQCLSNIIILKELGLDRGLRYLFPKLNSWQWDSLGDAGIAREDVIEIDAGVLQCEKLIYPLDLRNQPEVITTRSVKLAKEMLKNSAVDCQASRFGKKIYVSRFDSVNRQLLNEGAFVDHLRIRGYQILILEQMSFRDQMSAFHGADIIVGTHGAGLANMLFAKAGSVVVELNPFSDRTIFKTMADLCGLKYFEMKFSDPRVSADSLSPWTIENLSIVISELDKNVDLLLSACQDK